MWARQRPPNKAQCPQGRFSRLHLNQPNSHICTIPHINQAVWHYIRSPVPSEPAPSPIHKNDLTIEVHIYLKNDCKTGVTSRTKSTSVEKQPKRNRNGVEELFDSTDQKSSKGKHRRYLNSRTSTLWPGHSKPTLNALVTWRSKPSQNHIKNYHLYKVGLWSRQCNDGYYDAQRSKILASFQP